MHCGAMSRCGIGAGVQHIQQPLPASTRCCMLPSPTESRRKCSLRVLRISAAKESSDNSSKPRSSGFKNPFQAKNSKQDDARRALQEMFKGKADALSMYDPAPPGNGGSGGKGGSSGGGFGSWRDFDWRDWGKQTGGKFLGSLKSLGQVVGAMLLFGFIIALVSQGPPAIGLGISLVRRVLGLGGSGRSRPHLKETHHHHHHTHDALGPYESYVMKKYGADAGDVRTAAEQVSSGGAAGAAA